MHWLDRLFAQVLRYPQLYADGWGDEHVFERAQEGLLGLAATPVDPRWSEPVAQGSLVRRDLTFRSPVADELPPDVALAHARMWSRGPFSSDRPCVVVLAGSGGAGYGRRKAWLLPLVRHGVQALLLENPYYGRRTPSGQRGSRLRTFADQLRMNRATVAEALGLLEWLRARVPRVGVTGFSMGGHMAALTAAGSTSPVRCAALAAGRSPVPIYTTGALSTSIAWRTLGEQREGNPRARVGELLAAATATVPVPHPDSRLIIVAARRDGFVEAEQARALQASWPGSELRWLPGGHVTAVTRHARALRGAVLDSLGDVPPSGRST